MKMTTMKVGWATRVRVGVSAGLLTGGLMVGFWLSPAAPAWAEDDAVGAISERLDAAFGGGQADDGGGMGALEAVPQSIKVIRVRSGGGGGGRSTDRPRSGGALDVDIRTERDSYRVGDGIFFKVRGNKSFHLYLITADPETGRAIALLPNRYHTAGRIKYPGDGRWRKVPNPGAEFYADEAGTDRIIMVASEKYLNVDDLLRDRRTKAFGENNYESTGFFDWLDQEINQEYADELGAQPQKISVRGSEGRSLPSGLVVKELNLRIDG